MANFNHDCRYFKFITSGIWVKALIKSKEEEEIIKEILNNLDSEYIVVDQLRIRISLIAAWTIECSEGCGCKE